jgi:hypothetical protein
VPTAQDHLAKAESNERLSTTLQGSGHLDWSVTVLFYAALHLVEATLAPSSHSRNHTERALTVRTHPNLRPIFFHYRELYNRSLDARYNCQTYNLQIVRMLYANRYEPIKNHLRPILGLTF